MSEPVVCPCGKPARRRFCSRSCVGRYTGGKRPPSTHCRRCEWPMSGDNLYVSKDGRRRCRHCLLAKVPPPVKPPSPLANGQPGAARGGKRRAPRPMPSRDRTPKATPKAAEPAPVAPAVLRPVVTWRPAPEPVVRPVRSTPRPAFGLSRSRTGVA